MKPSVSVSFDLSFTLPGINYTMAPIGRNAFLPFIQTSDTG